MEQEIVNFLMDVSGRLPWVALLLMGLGTLVVVAQAVVLITPSKKDDELLEKIEKNSIGAFLLKVLTSFAPIAKK